MPISALIMSIRTVKGFFSIKGGVTVKFENSTVSFGRSDMFFVKKFGFNRAAEMVEEHYAKYKLPFIYDTHQLASLLGLSHNSLFRVLKGMNRYYETVTLRKKNGGVRVINPPCGFLKNIQRRILSEILNKHEISPYATAYVHGRHMSDNAEPHVGHKYLLKMDIVDFFGSISYLQVLSCAFSSKIYPKQIGVMLTSLCCKDEALPQGAPTSPMLSNIVMKSFDDVIGDWCKAHGITYTRYCDDLTFSGDRPLYTAYLKAKGMLEERGFEINEAKTHFITASKQQTVTGLTVNQKVSVPAEYKRRLRQEIYYSLKFGFADAVIHQQHTDFLKKERPGVSYCHHLLGKVNYVLSIEPENLWFQNARSSLLEELPKLD